MSENAIGGGRETGNRGGAMIAGTQRTVREILRDDREAIVGEWLEKTLQSYPEESRRFLGRERDPFRNPMGETFRRALPELYDELTGERNSARVAEALEPPVRIGAVQDFPPSRAIVFLFHLKAIVREMIPGETERTSDREDLEVFESAVDRAALTAFDLFMKCREEIHEIRAGEARNRVYLLERMRHGGPPHESSSDDPRPPNRSFRDGRERGKRP